MFKMCQEVVYPIFPSIWWCMVHHLHLIQTWLYKTPDPTLQHTVSPPLPISHANKELFLNTLHKKNCNSRVLKLSRLRRKTVSAARECRVGEAATSADTRHGNYPINLTFSASDVIQTQNMDCWQCWHPPTAALFYLIVSLSPVACIGIWLLSQTKCSISTVRNSIFRSTKQRIKLSSIWLVFCIFTFTLSPDSVTGVDKVFLWRCEPGLTFVLF